MRTRDALDWITCQVKYRPLGRSDELGNEGKLNDGVELLAGTVRARAAAA